MKFVQCEEFHKIKYYFYIIVSPNRFNVIFKHIFNPHFIFSTYNMPKKKEKMKMARKKMQA